VSDMATVVEKPDLLPPLARVARIAGTWDREELRVLKITVAVALLITVARAMAPFEIGKDQALQLQAAHRLVNGQGLTTPYFAAPLPRDVSVAPEPKFLTWWPPGFSLLVAGPLALGIPLGVVLRLVFGTATLLGWLGWGVLIARFMSRPLRIGSRLYHLQLPLAALLPLFTTPPWTGTDILLWAGIPHVFLLLLSPAHRRARMLPILAAGLLVGALVAIRYASAFLAVAACLILVQVNIHRLRSSFRQLVVACVAALALIVPTAIYIWTFSPVGAPVPEYISGVPDLSEAATSVLRIYEKLSVLSVLVVGSDLGVKVCSVAGSPALSAAVGLLSFLVVASVPLVLARYRAERPVVFRDDAALSLSLLPVSLVAFLLCVRMVSEGEFFGIARYYTPLGLCTVLVSYELLTMRPSNRVVKCAAAAIFSCFLIYLLVYLPAGLLVPSRRADLVRSVLGYTPAQTTRFTSTSVDLTYPSGEVFSLKEASKRVVSDLSAASPGAIFFVGNYPFYVYDGGEFGSADVRRLPPNDYWGHAFTSREIRVFWVRELSNAGDYMGDVEMRQVYVNAFEKTIILEAVYPAGFRWGED
jgi:hypothetical protein